MTAQRQNPAYRFSVKVIQNCRKKTTILILTQSKDAIQASQRIYVSNQENNNVDLSYLFLNIAVQ